jgi:hypothetical protein
MQLAKGRTIRRFFIWSFNDDRNLMSRGNVVAESWLIANNFIDFENFHYFGGSFCHHKTTAH